MNGLGLGLLKVTDVSNVNGADRDDDIAEVRNTISHTTFRVAVVNL